MNIRKYNPADKKNVQDICLYCDGYEDFKADTINFLLSTYCDYYTEQEPDNCFVAVNEKDEAVGYILCAENFDRFHKIFRNNYLTKIPEKDKTNRFYAEMSTVMHKKYKEDFPAHLHIDIMENYQRMGLGHKLMDALISHLKAKEIKGIMLTVNSLNPKGVAFYKKYGFDIIEENPDDIVFAMRLH